MVSACRWKIEGGGIVYIPEFVCGMIAGIVIGAVALIAIALIAANKDKK